MRRLVWIGFLAAVFWSLWWFYAATTLQRGIGQWFDDRRQEGWQAEATDVSVTGYPWQLKALVAEPALADPATGVAIEATFFELMAPAYWPGYATVLFPDDGITLATPRERVVLQATGARADLRLRPGSNLTLQEMALTSDAWSLNSAQGILWAADGLKMKVAQDDVGSLQYAFTADAPGFQPGGVPRRKLRIPNDWPLTFDSLQLNMTVLFDRPIDRAVIEVERAQPREITLDIAEALWGSLLLRANADLLVSDVGLFSGDLSLQVRDWKKMLAIAEAAGTLPSALRPQLENILAALARGSGNADSLDVKLSLDDGNLAMGFIPLGRVPPLVLP